MTDQPQPLDLDAIEARVNAATHGPWGYYDGGDYADVAAGYKPTGPISYTCTQSIARIEADEYEAEDDDEAANQMRADAEFITHARVDVPAMAAEIRRLTAELQQARQQTADRIAAELATIDPPEWAFAGQYGGQDAIRIARAVGAGCNCENADEPGHYVEHLTNAPRVTPCRAPHPVADSARCELPTGHRGWHAADVGSWPSSNWPPTTAPAAVSGA